MSKQMDTEICMISIPRNGLDNDYTFYESGKVHQLYDRHIYPGGQNREELLTVTDINDELRKQLLEHCPKEHIKKIKKIFSK